MAGVKFDVTSNIQQKVAQIKEALTHQQPLFAELNEYLLRIHRARFKRQESPDGEKWQALSPAYARRKHRNKDKVLTFRGHLQGTLRGVYDDTSLAFGTDRVYGAIHQFGGTIKRRARQHTLYFRQGRDGSVGNQFVNKGKSNFSQRANIGAYTITMPQRRWLGVSSDERTDIVTKTMNYLDAAAKR